MPGSKDSLVGLGLEETVATHSKALDKVTTALETNTEALHKVAIGLAKMEHLHQDQERLDEEVKVLKGQVRELELKPGQTYGKMKTWIASLASGVIGAIIIFFITKG